MVECELDPSWMKFGLTGPKYDAESETIKSVKVMIADSQCQGYCRQEEQVNMIVIASLDGRTRSKPELYKDQGQGESHDIKIHRGRGLGIAQGLKNIVVTSDLVITCCDQLHDALVKVR